MSRSVRHHIPSNTVANMDLLHALVAQRDASVMLWSKRADSVFLYRPCVALRPSNPTFKKTLQKSPTLTKRPCDPLLARSNTRNTPGMNDTQTLDLRVQLKIVASLRQTQYATDWRGIGASDKSVFTALRRTLLFVWENRVTAMQLIGELCDKSIAIMDRALVDHETNTHDPGFEASVQNPRDAVFQNAQFCRTWAACLRAAIGTPDMGLMTQYVVYSGDTRTLATLDGIVERMRAAVNRAEALFPDVAPALL